MTGIQARGLKKSYLLPGGGRRRALEGVNVDIAPGEFVALLGPSGCGKTTLLNILSGLDDAYEGTVSFSSADPGTGGRPRFSYMFQESRLLPWSTARENVRFVLDDGDTGGGRVSSWLERVGLADSADLYPSQLSVGMQQRVSLARALIVDPQVLFMDEPLSSLDELTATQMRDELLALWMEQRSTVVFVTHNPVEAVYLADRVLIMSPGPGRIIHRLDVTARLPRPRNADDPRVWELSRECVRILRGDPYSAG